MQAVVPSCELYCRTAAEVAGMFEATAPWGFVALCLSIVWLVGKAR